ETGTRRNGDKEKRGQGETGTRRNGDKEKRGQGDGERGEEVSSGVVMMTFSPETGLRDQIRAGRECQ
ncbi:MAG: hypothetical protein PHI84_13335, partial [Kiritimatiellae bacterium]|nr:hypothetical protein [Kiritimatiellia bacterium]